MYIVEGKKWRMVIMKIIHSSILQKVQQEKGDGKTDKFLVISYDLPSENLMSKEDENGKNLLNKRLKVGNTVRAKGVYLSDSCYIVNIERMEDLLKTIEETYSELSKEFAERVNVQVIGNAYSDVVLELLKTDIKEMTAKLKNDLEVSEARIDSIRKGNASSQMKQKNLNAERNKLYAVLNMIRILRNRIEDLKTIDSISADEHQKTADKLQKHRDDLIKEL